ncbi:MAG: hypothetical protein ACOYM5_02810 [Caulobacter sp.]
MAEKSDPPVDLLGDPWTPPRDPRGRKRHKRSPQIAEKIALFRATGLTVEQIACRSGLSEPTLRKYYFRELENADALARSVLVEAMYDKAKSGVVGAARFLREEFERGEVAVPVAKQLRPAAEAHEKLGKKAAADRDAQTAHGGTEWEHVLKH